MDQEREDAEAQKKEAEAQMREQARIRTAYEVISEEQLEALQSRLVALHEATDEESDTAIDWHELMTKAPMTTDSGTSGD